MKRSMPFTWLRMPIIGRSFSSLRFRLVSADAAKGFIAALMDESVLHTYRHTQHIFAFCDRTYNAAQQEGTWHTRGSLVESQTQMQATNLAARHAR
jgi:hypothetical protein